MKKAVVISGGISYKDIIAEYRKGYFIIAVDSGMNILDDMGILPDLLIGDFDSIDYRVKSSIIDDGSIEIIEKPSKKDETDTELAINYLIEEGFDEIIILSALGTRMDHSLGNINLLSKIEKRDIKGKIIDKNNYIEIISNEIEIIRDEEYKYISLIPFGGPVQGIKLKGFKYNAESLDLSEDSVMGISNEILSERAEISIKKGRLIMIRSRD